MAVLKLYTEIVDEETRQERLFWLGVDGMSFETIDSFIESIPENDDTIELRINSRGGDVMEGWAIYDKLRMTGKKIISIIEGQCSSMASVLLLAAPLENRSGYKNASLLIHKPFIPPYTLAGAYNADELRNIADELESHTTKIVNLYVERTGSDEIVLRSLMDEDKYIDMEKAKELGFISTILPPLSASKTSAKWHHSKIDNMAKTDKTEKVEVKKSFLNKLLAKYGYAKVEDAEAALEIVALDLTTADGSTLTIEREEGDPQVGDKASPDGEHLMPDGTTIIVVDGVITEIKNASNTSESEELAQAKAKIDELEQKLSSLQAQAKTQDELVILNKVKTMGGLEGLKKIASKYVPEGRGFQGNEGNQGASDEPVSLVEKKLAEKRDALKKKFNK